MSSLILPIASRYLTGSILTLVIPLGLLVVVAIWYVVVFPHGENDEP